MGDFAVFGTGMDLENIGKIKDDDEAERLTHDYEIDESRPCLPTRVKPLLAQNKPLQLRIADMDRHTAELKGQIRLQTVSMASISASL